MAAPAERREPTPVGAVHRGRDDDGGAPEGESLTSSWRGAVSASLEAIAVSSVTVEPAYLSPAEAARLIGVSRAKLYELAHAEGFPAHKLGARTLIDRQGLLAWFAARLREGLDTACTEKAVRARTHSPTRREAGAGRGV